ncbi:MAG TPA: hypothetical protein VJZ51_02110 [Bacilli bacterium]|nr:hypothetical protein [Bacilli bacterium]
MKKKLYDFSPATAIIVLSAYVIVITFFAYSAFQKTPVHWLSLVAMLLIIFSLATVIWYYVFLAITVTERGVGQGKKFIHKKDVKYYIEYNPRFRYSEIIFRNKYTNYEKLTAKEIRKQQIILQYFPKYEQFLEEFFEKKQFVGEAHEKK